MGTKIRWPEVGETVWVVDENFYRLPGKTVPMTDYTVKPYTCGRIHLNRRGDAPYEALLSDGHRLYYWRPGDNCGFFTAREAAMRAKELTELAESPTRAWMLDGPMRRTWEVYLQDGTTD